MIDNFAWASIIIRVISAIIIIGVIIHQIYLLRFNIKNQWIKYIMLGLASFMLFNYAQSLLLNFYRQGDGNLSMTARHFSQLSTALAGLASSSLAALLYLRTIKK